MSQSQTVKDVSYYFCCVCTRVTDTLFSSLPPQAPTWLQRAAAGQQGSLHSLFLFPMHIPFSDVTLKRHRAWENGAAEVFHQADSHFIILSA